MQARPRPKPPAPTCPPLPPLPPLEPDPLEGLPPQEEPLPEEEIPPTGEVPVEVRSANLPCVFHMSPLWLLLSHGQHQPVDSCQALCELRPCSSA